MKKKRSVDFLFLTAALAGLFFLSLGQTVAFGKTYYVDAAGGNDRNEGFSPKTAWQTMAKVNDTSFLPGDTILFKGGAVWETQLKPKASGSFEEHIVFDTYRKGLGCATLTKGINANGRSNLTFIGFRISGDGIIAPRGESSLYFNNCIIENTRSFGFYGGTAQLDIFFDHCVFSRNQRYHIYTGGTAMVTAKNCMFLSNQSTDEGPWSIGPGGNLDVDYSLINTAQVPSVANVTDGGHNRWYALPGITSYATNVIPRFVFTFDDTGSIPSFQGLASTAFAPYGVTGTIFVNPALLSGEQKTVLASLAAQGHEVANHTLNHEDLTATEAFSVSSTNTHATVTIDGATATVALWCDQPDNRVIVHWSKDTTVRGLKDTVAGKGWIITNSVQHGKERKDSLLLDELADSGGAQPVPYTCLLDISAPHYKFWDHEINDAQDQIQAITGIRPVTMAYPYGFYNKEVIAWIKVHTDLLSARQIGGAATSLASVPRWTFVQRPYGWTSSDPEAVVRQWADRLYLYAVNTPAYFLFYDHATDSKQWIRYGWMIDELKKLGAVVTTYAGLARWIASDHTGSPDSWVKAYDPGCADYHLVASSPAIDAGTPTVEAVDIDGHRICGFPDIGAYEYQPSDTVSVGKVNRRTGVQSGF